ncbi:hypothetical protein BJV77DRAFT_352170 [Russula vinacea]|nr:hypothetical protein BJV77DRAFT_352170 [Russula vinacea]
MYPILPKLRLPDYYHHRYRALTDFSLPAQFARGGRTIRLIPTRGQHTNGISKGALVRFSEEDATNSTSDITTTPWIALVACDANATHASQDTDIFTLANDRGAVGALLYSEWSSACIINAWYKDPATFSPLMDIYSTQSLASARVILSQLRPSTLLCMASLMPRHSTPLRPKSTKRSPLAIRLHRAICGRRSMLTMPRAP